MKKAHTLILRKFNLIFFFIFLVSIGFSCSKKDVEDNPEVEKISVLSVSLDKESLNLNRGEETTLIATVLPENATDKTIEWKSSNTNVVTVDNQGKVVAVNEGDAVVKVITKDGNKTFECKVSVVIKPSGITLNKSTLELYEGNDEMLKATVDPKDVKGVELEWSTSNDKVATVSKRGTVEAIAPGDAEVKVVIKGTDLFAVCKVKVLEIDVVVPKELPALLVAPYNMKGDNEFDKENKTNTSYYYGWNAAQTKFAKEGGVEIEGVKYHLPCIEEWTGIFPQYKYGAQNYVEFKTTDYIKDIEETIMIKGSKKVYKADYKGDGTRVYGLKMKPYSEDGDYKYMSAFKYEWVSYGSEKGSIKVTVRYLGEYRKKTTVLDVAKDEFWKKNNEDDITLSFPACGFILNLGTDGSAAYDSGKTKEAGTYGGYLSTSEYAADKSIWGLYFDQNALRGCYFGEEVMKVAGQTVRLFKIEGE
jgi:Bacterial surface proteins containing Ig-like domains